MMMSARLPLLQLGPTTQKIAQETNFYHPAPKIVNTVLSTLLGLSAPPPSKDDHEPRTPPSSPRRLPVTSSSFKENGGKVPLFNQGRSIPEAMEQMDQDITHLANNEELTDRIIEKWKTRHIITEDEQESSREEHSVNRLANVWLWEDEIYALVIWSSTKPGGKKRRRSSMEVLHSREITNCDGHFQALMDTVRRVRTTHIAEGTRRGSGSHNLIGLSSVDRSTTSLTEVLNYTAAPHIRSTGAAACMLDSMRQVTRCLVQKPMTEKQEEALAKDPQSTTVCFRNIESEVSITKNLLRPKNKEEPRSNNNAFQDLPSDHVYWCVASSVDNVKHAFVIDYRHTLGGPRFPVLLDSVLPTPVRYDKDSTDWIKNWQKVYQMDVKLECKNTKNNKRRRLKKKLQKEEEENKIV
jgi:hypothetical protein